MGMKILSFSWDYNCDLNSELIKSENLVLVGPETAEEIHPVPGTGWKYKCKDGMNELGGTQNPEKNLYCTGNRIMTAKQSQICRR